MQNVFDITERQRQASVAYDDGFDFSQPTLTHRQSHTQINRRAILLRRAYPNGLTGLCVGSDQTLRRNACDRSPQPFRAERHLDVVFGKAQLACHRQTLGITLRQSGHISRDMASEAGVVTVGGKHRAVVAGRLRLHRCAQQRRPCPEADTQHPQ